MLSLLDLGGRDAVSWFVVFMDRENVRWWNALLKPGYQHVQLWRPIQYGAQNDEKFWLVVDPGLDHVDTHVDWNSASPWERGPFATVMRVEVAVRVKQVRDWFFFGPITCVELAKAHLGICSVWIRTPWQLAKYLRARRHTLVLR
jgi:hypothetical protein